MSEVNRTSASEQARADQISAEQRKQKPQLQKNALQHGAAKHYAQSQSTAKREKSVFDSLLENMTESQTNAPIISSEAKFDGKLQEISQHNQHRDSEDSSDDNETRDQNTDHKKTESSRDSKGATQRQIHAKSGLKSGQQGGSHAEHQNQGQKQATPKGEFSMLQAEKTLKSAEIAAPAPSPSTLQLQQTQAAMAAQGPKTLPKAVLDQIVQMVTIRQSKELGKEIEIDFQDNFFNGLKLRVTAKHEAIGIEFIVPNGEVENLFRNEKDQIATALGEKGIDLRSIEITRR